MRPIPNSVIREAAWWLGGVPTQRHPKAKRPTRPATKARRAAQPMARASMGQAARWALYAWSKAWTEATLAEAIADVTRRVDRLRAVKRRAKQRTNAQASRELSQHLRTARTALRAPDILADVDRYLRRHKDKMRPETPAYADEIRARVYAEPVRAAARRDAAWSGTMDAPNWPRVFSSDVQPPTHPVRRVLRPTVRTPEPTRTVSMGQLAAIAAEEIEPR